MAPVITFDEAAHAYRVDGHPVPSVTQVLKPLYGDLRFVQPDLLEYKSTLGRAVHRAIELHVLNDLQVDSLDDTVAAYFAQFLLFEADRKFVATGAEVRVAHPLGYAGTVDLIGSLDCSAPAGAMIDVKTTAALSPAVKLQTAAYQQAYKSQCAPGQHAPLRYALRLTESSYHLTPYKPSTDGADFAAFLGLLKIHQWCQANSTKIEGFSHV